MEDKKTLFNLTEELQQLILQLEDAEIDDETQQNIIDAQFEGGGTQEKLNAYCDVIKGMEARKMLAEKEKEAIKITYDEMVKPYSKRIEVIEHQIERMKKAMYQTLAVMGKEKVETDKYKIKQSQSESVEYDKSQIKLIVAWCEANGVADKLIKTSYTMDKKETKKFLKTYAGKKINGVELIVKDGVKISV